MKKLILAVTRIDTAYAHAREENTGEETTYTPIEMKVETSHDGGEGERDERWALGRHTIDMGKFPEAELPSRDCLATKSESRQPRREAGQVTPDPDDDAKGDLR